MNSTATLYTSTTVMDFRSIDVSNGKTFGPLISPSLTSISKITAPDNLTTATNNYHPSRPFLLNLIEDTFDNSTTESSLMDDNLINHILTTSLRSAIEYNCTDLDSSAISTLLGNLTSNGTSGFLSANSSLYNNIINNDWNSSSVTVSSTSYCPSAWDGVSCWARTLAGQLAIIPCFSQLNGVDYDTSQNATRLCLDNGIWAERADYDQCQPLKIEQIPIENLYTTNIYYFGYGLSLLGLSIALFIFLYFKDLRCVRNTIHTNLMVTYLLIATCWITTDRLHANPSSTSQKASCITVILLTYLMGTNFSWMFVEGLYLYILVVKTFSIEFVKITNYMIIGWGSPAIVILCWLLIKHYFSNYDSKLVQCPYQAQDEFDYIYKVPILLVLMINIFFLGKIMWVLIIKLRASNSIESKQYRKAAKALLVLIPLLGVGYMLVLVTPTHPTAKLVFQYLQAILVSTQGFTVAVLYCFCNGEVRNSLKHHFQRFKLRRTLRYGGEYPAQQSTYYRTTAYSSYNHHHHHHNRNEKNRKNPNLPTTNEKRGNNNSGNGRIKIGRLSCHSTDSTGSKIYRNIRSRDSCISYTTTTSFLVTGFNNDGNGTSSHAPESRCLSGGNIATNTNNGYHSIPTTPDDDEVHIEMQAL